MTTSKEIKDWGREGLKNDMTQQVEEFNKRGETEERDCLWPTMTIGLKFTQN